MQKTEQTLKENGLVYNKPLEHTPITPNPKLRGEEILSYLQSKSQPYDFVIIDDESFDFDKHFDKKKIIKTNAYKESFNLNMVNAFIKMLDKDLESEKY